MASTFEEMEEIAQKAGITQIEDGDECPEVECGDGVTHLDHSMEAQFGTMPNVEAPENELVCPTHGIVDSYNN